MKAHLSLIACLSLSLYAAESSQQPREWMAEQYARTNKDQVKSFSYWLENYKIQTKDQNIISFGCGPGDIEYQLAQSAQSVLGTDQSKTMVEYAQNQYASQKNLSFQQCAAEDFQPQKLYDLAIAANCVHWFANKPKAFEQICSSLKPGGRFFANIETTSNPEAFGVTVFNEMKQDIPIIGNLLAALPNPTGTSRPTFGELHIMLSNAGFNILRTILESWNYTMTEQEWRQAQLPLLLSTAGAQMLINTTSGQGLRPWMAEQFFQRGITLSPQEKEQHDAPFFPECSDELVEKIRSNNFCRCIFNRFLNRCLQKLQKNADGTYTWKYETTLIVAQKK